MLLSHCSVIHEQVHLNPVQAVVQFRPSMKNIDAHDAAKKKSDKDAGTNDGDEEMFDAEPNESKSELTLLQVGLLCSLYQSSSSSRPRIFFDAAWILPCSGTRSDTC